MGDSCDCWAGLGLLGHVMRLTFGTWVTQDGSADKVVWTAGISVNLPCIWQVRAANYTILINSTQLIYLDTWITLDQFSALMTFSTNKPQWP